MGHDYPVALEILEVRKNQYMFDSFQAEETAAIEALSKENKEGLGFIQPTYNQSSSCISISSDSDNGSEDDDFRLLAFRK